MNLRRHLDTQQTGPPPCDHAPAITLLKYIKLHHQEKLFMTLKGLAISFFCWGAEKYYGVQSESLVMIIVGALLLFKHCPIKPNPPVLIKDSLSVVTFSLIIGFAELLTDEKHDISVSWTDILVKPFEGLGYVKSELVGKTVIRSGIIVYGFFLVSFFINELKLFWKQITRRSVAIFWQRYAMVLSLVCCFWSVGATVSYYVSTLKEFISDAEISFLIYSSLAAMVLSYLLFMILELRELLVIVVHVLSSSWLGLQDAWSLLQIWLSTKRPGDIEQQSPGVAEDEEDEEASDVKIEVKKLGLEVKGLNLEFEKLNLEFGKLKTSNEKLNLEFGKLKTSNEKFLKDLKTSNEKLLKDLKTSSEKLLKDLKTSSEKLLKDLKTSNEKLLKDLKTLNKKGNRN